MLVSYRRPVDASGRLAGEVFDLAPFPITYRRADRGARRSTSEQRAAVRARWRRNPVDIEHITAELRAAGSRATPVSRGLYEPRVARLRASRNAVSGGFARARFIEGKWETAASFNGVLDLTDAGHRDAIDDSKTPSCSSHGTSTVGCSATELLR